MSTKKAKSSAKGRRYSAKEKSEILAYVDTVNSEKGRGGQSAASKKYKISPLTISNWIKAGFGSGNAPAPKSKASAPASAGKSAASTVSTSGPISKKLAKLQSLHEQIVSTEKELAKLTSQFNTLKASL